MKKKNVDLLNFAKTPYFSVISRMPPLKTSLSRPLMMHPYDSKIKRGKASAGTYGVERRRTGKMWKGRRARWGAALGPRSRAHNLPLSSSVKNFSDGLWSLIEKLAARGERVTYVACAESLLLYKFTPDSFPLPRCYIWTAGVGWILRLAGPRGEVGWMKNMTVFFSLSVGGINRKCIAYADKRVCEERCAQGAGAFRDPNEYMDLGV